LEPDWHSRLCPDRAGGDLNFQGSVHVERRDTTKATNGPITVTAIAVDANRNLGTSTASNATIASLATEGQDIPCQNPTQHVSTTCCTGPRRTSDLHSVFDSGGT